MTFTERERRLVRKKGLAPARESQRLSRRDGGRSDAPKRASARFGAEERTRTFTPLREPAPEAGASANSATSAVVRNVPVYPSPCAHSPVADLLDPRRHRRRGG